MAQNHRLPTHITPNRYQITLKPDLEKFTFIGEETIYISIKKATQKIVLHSVELVIDKVTILDGGIFQQGSVTYDAKAETAIITFKNSLSIGEKELHLTFSGILNDKMHGFYRSKYEIEGQHMYMATTQFEATDARRAFPCFDEPSLKAIFDVTLIIPSDHTAISNTLPEVEKEHESGLKMVKFSPTPKMSTYLLACIVGKFESVETKIPLRQGFEGQAKEVLVRVFTTPGKKHQATFALETAAKTLSFYSEYFAIPYPLPVLDLIAIPDFASGAMENWGAVTFRETTVLVDPENSSTGNKQWVGLVIAHELAHMWFGNLVTMQWWTHLWLNEGFACFIEYLAVNAIFPEWEIWKQFISTEHNDALGLDSLKNTHPIEVPVKHPSEISEIFDEVSYAKGASIIRMLWLYLGEEDFRDGLRYYLKTHAYSNTKTEDLWKAFETVSKKPVGKIMKYWTQKAGYPLIYAQEKNKKLVVTQQRFFSSSLSKETTKDTTIWNIPLQIQTDKGVKKYLMNKKTFVIPSERSESRNLLQKKSVEKDPSMRPSDLVGMTKWMKLNAGESSFVRVHYPNSFIAPLKKAIETNAISDIDKLGIIRDAFSLAEANIGSTVDALSLVSSYKKEKEYVLWAEIAGNIHKLTLMLSDTVSSTLFSAFAKSIFADIAQYMGWERKAGEKHTDALLRSIALYGFGTYGDHETLAKAQELFHEFVKKHKPIHPDLRGVVYSLVAENGGEKEWEEFKRLHNTESLHQEKDRLARAMTSFKKKELLIKTAEWSLSEDIRAQDSIRLLYALFINEKGKDIAWNFLVKHWEHYEKQYSGAHGFTRVVEAASVFTTDEKAEEIEKFFAVHKVAELDRAVKQVVEKIRANALWVEKQAKEIEKYLHHENI